MTEKTRHYCRIAIVIIAAGIIGAVFIAICNLLEQLTSYVNYLVWGTSIYK